MHRLWRQVCVGLGALLAATCLAVAGPPGANAKLAVAPKVKSVQLDDEIDFRVLGSKRRCKVSLNGQGVGVSYSSRRGTRFSWAFQDEGAMSFKVRCGKSRTSFTVQVAASSEDSEPGTGSPANGSPATPTPPPSTPRLTGSDAEAEEHWQRVRHYFTNLARGKCSDYAYSRRPDIPEKIEKAAYKQWVADGAPIFESFSPRPVPSGKTGTEVWQFVDASHAYAEWGAISTSDERNAWVAGARRAGLTVDFTPNPGDIEVTFNHVRVVEALLPPNGTTRQHWAYEYTEMNYGTPGVAKGVAPISEQDFRASNTYFVG